MLNYTRQPGQRLALGQLLERLQAQGLATSSDLHPLLLRQPPGDTRHPLVQLAECQLPDPGQPGQYLTLDWLTRWLAKEAGLPWRRIDSKAMDAHRLAGVMSAAFARHHQLLPIEIDAERVVIASAEPWVVDWEADLATATGLNIERVVANPEEIARHIEALFKLARSMAGACVAQAQIEQLQRAPEAQDAPIVDLVDWLLGHAFEQRASDIHLEPREAEAHIRLRIDGALRPVHTLPPAVALAMASRLKGLAGMNLAERRKPQDGRYRHTTSEGKTVELRLATLPTAYGEKLVLRLFDASMLNKTFTDLGLAGELLERWQHAIKRPNGIILVTGPTGSGKTTTLYATLHELARPEVNISTVEDPVEMVHPALNQMQVRASIDLNFASGLRALMRQDPDIIMVGEIRDEETARMATQAALTGHLVLSTLHTNDAPGAVSRLRELGVAPYLISATLVAVMAQRLVRLLCDHCKQAQPLTQAQWQSLIHPWRCRAPEQVYRAIGCEHCNQGYKGRLAIYELMSPNDTLREAIGKMAPLGQLAMSEGMRPLKVAAALRLAAGHTSLEEVLRVIST